MARVRFPASKPAIPDLSLVLVIFSASRGLSRGSLISSSPQKPTFKFKLPERLERWACNPVAPTSRSALLPYVLDMFYVKEPIKMGKFIKIYLKTRFQSESRCLLKKAFLLEVNYSAFL